MEKHFGFRMSSTALLLLLGAACAAPHSKVATAQKLQPPPTEGQLTEAEGGSIRERQAWIESMHRAAPGVNWRAIEKENHLINLARQAEAASRSAVTASPAGGVWLQRGPTNQTGRTWVTAVTSDNSTLLVGSGDIGGLFSGTPGSTSWAERGNPLGYGVQELVVVPGSPESWVAVVNRNSEVFVSTDQGVSWQTPGGLPGQACGFVVPRLVREPGSRRVYLLVTTPYCATSTFTLLRSDDAGLNFVPVKSASYTAAPDMWMDRINAGPLYLLTDSGFLSSSNYGASFTMLGVLPSGAGDTLRLAGSEAGAPMFYALRTSSSSNTGNLFASANGGLTWASRGSLSGLTQGDPTLPNGDPYLVNDLLTASISNPSVLMLGGIDAYRSTDGGVTFQPVSYWWQAGNDPAHLLHADVRGFDFFFYRGTETLFADTDGGTYMSSDLGATFNNMTQYGIINGEYYSTLTSKNNPDLIAAGSQDQGLQQSQPAQLAAMSFNALPGGDCGHLTSTAGDHNQLYASSPGAIVVLDHESSPHSVSYVNFPPGNRSWMPNILADPANANAVYLTGDPLYRLYQDSGGWHPTAFAQNFSAGDGDYLTALAISKVNQSYWYAASSQGRMWYSHNQGATWTLSASQGPWAHYFYGTTLLPSTTSATTCYVGGSGYSGPAVYKTTDGGVTWQAMGTGLPSTLVLGLAFDDPATQNLYAVADAGPFAFDSGSASWRSILSDRAPLTGYWSVEGVPALHAVRFGTYGKGIWDLRLIPPGRDFYTVPPCRLVDTRLASGALTGPALQPQANRVFAVAGVCGVPSTARAVSVNVAVVAGSSAGYFTFGASDKALPVTSTVNFTASSTKGNNALLELSTDGAGGFVVFNGSPSPAQLILDVNGYFQ